MCLPWLQSDVVDRKKNQFTQLGKTDISEWSKEHHHELIRLVSGLASIMLSWYLLLGQ